MIALNQSTFNNLNIEATPTFFEKFDEYLNLEDIIPMSFKENYYLAVGSKRKYSLVSMIKFFILKNILNISNYSDLLRILFISSELRYFCGFDRVPHASQISRFATKFLNDINELLHNLVDTTNPMIKQIQPFLSSILISDTTGFEAYVTENNPKFYPSLLRTSKNLSKVIDDKDFDPEKHARSQCPKCAHSNPDITLSFLNNHFGYYLKANIVTDGLGIIRHIDFYDEEMDFSSGPNSAKNKYDSKTLIPVLENYFTKHPTFNYDYFIADAGFDSGDNYEYLIKDRNLSPIIPINPRNESNLPESGFTPEGIPTCPFDSTLEMKFDGITREKGRSTRLKYICPKSKKCNVNGHTSYILSCEKPCTKSKCGRIIQVCINKNYRLNTPVPRNTERWKNLYKIRTVCERAIAQIKSCFNIKSTYFRNTNTMKSNILFSGITQLITVVMAYKSNNFDNLKSIKSLVA